MSLEATYALPAHAALRTRRELRAEAKRQAELDRQPIPGQLTLFEQEAQA